MTRPQSPSPLPPKDRIQSAEIEVIEKFRARKLAEYLGQPELSPAAKEEIETLISTYRTFSGPDAARECRQLVPTTPRSVGKLLTSISSKLRLLNRHFRNSGKRKPGSRYLLRLRYATRPLIDMTRGLDSKSWEVLNPIATTLLHRADTMSGSDLAFHVEQLLGALEARLGELPDAAPNIHSQEAELKRSLCGYLRAVWNLNASEASKGSPASRRNFVADILEWHGLQSYDRDHHPAQLDDLIDSEIPQQGPDRKMYR